jgi:predicted amidohydrolase
MKERLSLTFMQLDTVWESPGENEAIIERLFLENKVKTNILVLPEMFTTGFTMEPEKVAENMGGKTSEWMFEKARDWNCVITGSIVIREKEHYYNRMLWVTPEGQISHYDKKHLFRMGEENEHYTAGNNKLIAKLGEWSFRPLICYDLRFPVWSRNTSDYDVLLYVANWPESRREVWKSLLVARALENQAYVVGVNRIGLDGRDISYSGDSLVIDPRGQIISHMKPYEEAVETVDISLEKLRDFREKFPVYLDADRFTILP